MKEHADKIRKLSGSVNTGIRERSYSRKLNQTLDSSLAKNKIPMIIQSQEANIFMNDAQNKRTGVKSLMYADALVSAGK
jgi:hypothetical protein